MLAYKAVDPKAVLKQLDSNQEVLENAHFYFPWIIVIDAQRKLLQRTSQKIKLGWKVS